MAAFESPEHIGFAELHRIVYGEKHPLSYEAGGTPAGLREVTVEKIRKFQSNHYNLKCGGLLAFLPVSSGGVT